jgi:hypothetical protein
MFQWERRGLEEEEIQIDSNEEVYKAVRYFTTSISLRNAGFRQAMSRFRIYEVWL